ncbi:hypothetical protein M413DRAFT_445663 [Hebeloma cylindrosporum]|uniref:MYND-type domain-containing protein n=1 Tax=Hebeloma cylindrosporum TaxID=76867 RepID=A0A0C3BW94_HEBCY|nr:hypothetical protein M413DRAFT_445663 [Hebeloma cylindrosporum h7]
MNSNPRTIYLPLEKLEKCAFCRKTAKDVPKLMVCTSCSEVIYCSSACQKEDWTTHKPSCGLTDKIDLESYYGFLATVAHSCRIHPDIQRPALTHQIINCPRPDAGDVVTFPDGSGAKIVLLGQPIPPTALLTKLWWPEMPSVEVGNRLMRRIITEGLLLPILLATCLGLASEMYTTTAVRGPVGPDGKRGAALERRVRLSHHKSPVADFGIVHGSVRDGSFMIGQDPDDHHWIYFTLLNGHEYYLELGMMPFNFGIVVDTTPYCPPGQNIGMAPAHFYGRDIERELPVKDRLLWTAKKRFSILRDPRLQAIAQSIGFSGSGYSSTIWDLMEDIAERKCSDWEKDMVMKFLVVTRDAVRLNILQRKYEIFPPTPAIGISTDPGENLASEKELDEFQAYARKLAKKLKKGKISEKKWEAAYKNWHRRRHEGKMISGEE